MPFIPGGLPAGANILGLTAQNYQLLMGVSGIVCAGIIFLIWARSL